MCKRRPGPGGIPASPRQIDIRPFRPPPGNILRNWAFIAATRPLFERHPQTPRIARSRSSAARGKSCAAALARVAAACLVGSVGCGVHREVASERWGRIGPGQSGPVPADQALAARPSGLDTHAANEVGPRQSLLSLSNSELWAAWNSLRGDAYELDSVERFLEDGQRVECKPQALVRHSGSLFRYQSSAQVDPAFRDRLIRFEQLVAEVAAEVYGRAPTRLHHLGTYNCRPSRNRSYRMSEHALGNAIDISGFDFARGKKQSSLSAGLPAQLHGPFQVRVSRHWNADVGDTAVVTSVAAIHSRFLRELSSRLVARSDIFRGMIGPSHRGHADHFHFDMSPWRYVRF